MSQGPGAFGTLRGHVARANPIWKDIVIDVEALAIFHGPDAYITPSWYPSKAETGKVVPTWNYAVAHAYGTLRVIDDATWLGTHLRALSAHNEAAFAEPWQPDDAPADFIEKLVGAIVGIEIVITRLSGKWKTSQNQPAENQAGVVRGLRASGPVTYHKVNTGSRSEAAKYMGEHSDEICQSKGLKYASSIAFPESQCWEQ